MADVCLSGIERWGDLVSSTCQVKGRGWVPNTMSETGRGGPVRVRGTLNLVHSAGSCCRPPSLTNRELTRYLGTPSRRVLTCWVAPHVTPSFVFAHILG